MPAERILRGGLGAARALLGAARARAGAGMAGSEGGGGAGPSVVFVLGGPGSGKGTQCARLVEGLGFSHLSAGDLLRAHMKSGSPEGQMVADMIKQGQIVPSEVTVNLLKDAMAADGGARFLIDGFPRNVENRQAFEEVMGYDCRAVLFFDCPEAVMEKRLLSRNEGRTDDNIETIKRRFKVFIEQSMPVVEHYKSLGKVIWADSDRQPDEIYAEIAPKVEKFVPV